MKTIQQIRSELDQPIPRDVISKRQAAAGMYLDYLEGWYVIDRLNKIFGQGNWAYTLDELNLTFNDKIGERFYVSYLAKVSLKLLIEGHLTTFTDIGFGDGQDRINPGKCHELASKEAVTDGIKRCAKSLGMSMGLALYDKSKENVVDEKLTNETANINNKELDKSLIKDNNTVKNSFKFPIKKQEPIKLDIKVYQQKLKNIYINLVNNGSKIDEKLKEEINTTIQLGSPQLIDSLCDRLKNEFKL